VDRILTRQHLASSVIPSCSEKIIPNIPQSMWRMLLRHLNLASRRLSPGIVVPVTTPVSLPTFHLMFPLLTIREGTPLVLMPCQSR
jgi:hypothetical protein